MNVRPSVYSVATNSVIREGIAAQSRGLLGNRRDRRNAVRQALASLASGADYASLRADGSRPAPAMFGPPKAAREIPGAMVHGASARFRIACASAPTATVEASPDVTRHLADAQRALEIYECEQAAKAERQRLARMAAHAKLLAGG